MARAAAKLALLSTLVVAAALVLYVYNDKGGERQRRVEAERKNEQLRQVIDRLGAEQRVADIIVIDQETDDAGVLKTTLLFVEYAPDGSPLPAKRFTIDGNVAYVDAMVIKFDGRFVEENDPLRGRSIALFTRLYGEKQAPEKGHRIDQPNTIPDVYRGGVKVSDFERELWANFWKLAEDDAYRKQMGVRVAQGEAVWTKFQPDRLYTLTLESDGGLNITSAPLKGIYREALKSAAPTPA